MFLGPGTKCVVNSMKYSDCTVCFIFDGVMICDKIPYIYHIHVHGYSTWLLDR
jgi:hypothetical protein